MLAAVGAALIIGSLLVMNSEDNKNNDDIYREGLVDFLYGLSTKNKLRYPMELNSLTGKGVMCSESFRLSRRQSNEHVLMIAPSGAGKSRRFIIPNVNNLKDCSIVVTDPCGEIEKTCRADKKIYILNPFSSNSIGYDPLASCRSEFEVRKMAKVILMNGSQSSRAGKATNHQDWIEMAIPLFSAYLIYCYHTKKYNFAQVITNICTMPILPPDKEMSEEEYRKYRCIHHEIMASDVTSAKVELYSFLQVMGARQTLSSIRSVLNTCLQVFLDEGLMNIFSKPSLDFSVLRKEESILFIQIPERHAEYFAPLTATFMIQLIDNLLDNSGLQIYMLLDEFTNIGILPDMTKLLSTARKHNLSIVAAIQSITQLTRVYGEIEGKELQELFKCILCTCGIKDSSADYISSLLGSTEKFVNGTLYTKPLMTPENIRCMKSDDMLIICNNKRPVKDCMLNPVF